MLMTAGANAVVPGKASDILNPSKHGPRV
jgi:hypothetical protein